jgi:hypothetical protein
LAVIAEYFIDTSAAARMHVPVVAARIAPLIHAGKVATCAVLDAEALYSTHGGKDYERVRAERGVAYEYVPINDEDWVAALEAQRALAQSGRHRAVGMSDLLTSVLAARHRLTVVHYDADFEIAAEVVDFGHRWATSPGTA